MEISLNPQLPEYNWMNAGGFAPQNPNFSLNPFFPYDTRSYRKS
jgi:hypothetical protein